LSKSKRRLKVENQTPTTKTGSVKICPMMTADLDYPSHCLDQCEWNDGDGCAIWRIVKGLDMLVSHLANKFDFEEMKKLYEARKG